MTDKKTCKYCQRTLPLSEFYTNGKNRDGYSCGCKECRRKAAQDRRYELSQDSEWVEKERARTREKYHRLGYSNRRTQAYLDKGRSFRGTRGARLYWKRHGVTIPSDMELHHWNYKLPHEVLVLPRRVHHRLHADIRLEMPSGIYVHGDERLDTLEKHLAVIKDICSRFGIDYSEVSLLQ